MSIHNFKIDLLIPFILILLTISSCSDPEQEPFMCNDDALLLKEDVTGTMVYLTCYDSWSVKLDETNVGGSHLIAASIGIAEEYQVDSLRVKLDACLYEFDLELLFPDPAPWGELYVMKDYNISTEL